jgi:O-antigen/teichoic acid export membrane protein
VLGAALLAANASNYLIAVAASHRLSTSSYGLFSALLAVLLVASIPSLALQAVVARRTTLEGWPRSQAIRTGSLTGLASAVVLMAATPLLRDFLHVPHGGIALVWIALGLVPLNLLACVQGQLQGSEAFTRLSVLVVVVGVGRLLGGLLPLVAGGGPAWVMAGIASSGAIVATVAIRLATPRGLPTDGPAGRVAPELVRATVSMGALLLLANLDLLLARHLLPSRASGHYAAGSVVAKVAFWLPQAVPLTALPRLSRATGRERALREAAVVTAVVALASIAVTTAAGPVLLARTFGPDYRDIGQLAWLFAIQGSALAGVQLLIVDDIANRRMSVVPLVLAAIGVETAVLLIVAPSTPRPVVIVAAATTVGLGVAAALRLGQAIRSHAQWAASAQLLPKPTDTSKETSSL